MPSLFKRSMGIKISFLAIAGLLMLGFQNCIGTSPTSDQVLPSEPLENPSTRSGIGGGTTTGNGKVDIVLRDFNPFLNAFGPNGVSVLNICFTRIYFFGPNGSLSYPIANEIVELNPSGTSVASLAVAPDSYIAVGLQIGSACLDSIYSSTANPAVSLKNDLGFFRTSEAIYLEFHGTFNVGSDPGQQLILPFESIVGELNNVQKNTDIKPLMESANWELLRDGKYYLR